MISKEKAQLESKAIESLQELYSDDGGEDDALDQYNQSRSPTFSGWDSPYKTGINFSTAPSERSKVSRKFSESPVKGKSTLSNLSENLHRIHMQAFQMRKVYDEPSENMTKQYQNTTQQSRQVAYSRKNLNSYTFAEGVKPVNTSIQVQQQAQQKNVGDLTIFPIALEAINQRQQQDIQIVGIAKEYQQQESQEKRKNSFRKYTEQYHCKTQQQDFTPLNSTSCRSSRTGISVNKQQQESRQQANIAVSNIDLYCVEESLHANKDFKSTFRVIWKKQDRLNTSYSRNNSLEKVLENNFTSVPQSRTSMYQKTEASSLQTFNEFNYEDFLETTSKGAFNDGVINQNSNGNQRYNSIQLKNLYQRQVKQQDSNNPISIIDNSKIQTVFHNDSENSTQESTRKSSNSIINMNATTTLSKQDLIESCSHQQIPTERTHILEKEEGLQSQLNEEQNSVISEVIVPIHNNRMKTEQQTRMKQPNNRPMSQHMNSKSVYSDNSFSQFVQPNNLYQKQVNAEQQPIQQYNLLDSLPSYEIAHKSFKQYNIPITLRTHSLQKRQYSSRKGSNVSNDSRRINKSINDTLLFNIYKPNQIPAIQQRLNAFIQNQEDTNKTQFLQNKNLNTEISNEKQNKTIFYSPLKNKNYCKYKPSMKIERQSSLNTKGNNNNLDNLNSILIVQNN